MWSAETDKNIYLIEQDKVSNEFTYSLNGYTLSKPCRTHLKMMAHFNLPSPKQTIISILADGEVINLNFAQGNIGKCIKSIKASLTCDFTVIGARVFTLLLVAILATSCSITFDENELREKWAGAVSDDEETLEDWLTYVDVSGLFDVSEQATSIRRVQ